MRIVLSPLYSLSSENLNHGCSRLKGMHGVRSLSVHTFFASVSVYSWNPPDATTDVICEFRRLRLESGGNGAGGVEGGASARAKMDAESNAHKLAYRVPQDAFWFAAGSLFSSSMLQLTCGRTLR
jgi:hypothetical protein